MGFIFILSSVPGEKIPRLFIPFFHKTVHFVEYFVLGVFFVRAFTRSASRPRPSLFTVISLLLAGLFAVSDEWHQTFTPGRTGCLGDALYDLFCSAAGIYFYNFLNMRAKKKAAGNK